MEKPGPPRAGQQREDEGQQCEGVGEAAEGEAAIVERLSPDDNTCPIAPSRRLTRILVEAFDALYDSLDAYTLADLVGNRRVLRRVLAAG